MKADSRHKESGYMLLGSGKSALGYHRGRPCVSRPLRCCLQLGRTNIQLVAGQLRVIRSWPVVPHITMAILIRCCSTGVEERHEAGLVSLNAYDRSVMLSAERTVCRRADLGDVLAHCRRVMPTVSALLDEHVIPTWCFARR